MPNMIKKLLPLVLHDVLFATILLLAARWLLASGPIGYVDVGRVLAESKTARIAANALQRDVAQLRQGASSEAAEAVAKDRERAATSAVLAKVATASAVLKERKHLSSVVAGSALAGGIDVTDDAIKQVDSDEIEALKVELEALKRKKP